MAYRAPSSRRKRKEVTPPNLIPILDAVFIFIFFLLMSASFIKIYEIPSEVPTVSNKPAPKDKKLFVLTLKIKQSEIILHQVIGDKNSEKSFKRGRKGYDLNGLHNFLLGIKKRHKLKNTIIFEPFPESKYEEIVNIMDAVRLIRKTDSNIYIKDTKTGADRRIISLFDNIIFGNIQS
jgi:biopolymer transport protein ExbD